MRATAIAFVLAALAPAAEPASLRGDEIVVNTPVVAGRLRGEWELRPTDGAAFRQRLHLGGSVEGSWRQGRDSLPVTIAWFVEGAELRILHYYEPNGAFNYRVKDLTFAYRIDGDELTLSKDGVTQTWRRVTPPAAGP